MSLHLNPTCEPAELPFQSLSSQWALECPRGPSYHMGSNLEYYAHTEPAFTHAIFSIRNDQFRLLCLWVKINPQQNIRGVILQFHWEKHKYTRSFCPKSLLLILPFTG